MNTPESNDYIEARVATAFHLWVTSQDNPAETEQLRAMVRERHNFRDDEHFLGFVYEYFRQGYARGWHDGLEELRRHINKED